jgi:hypothetical protein
MSIMEKAEYPLVIVAMQEIIEIRLKDTVKPVSSGKSTKSGKSKK